MKRFILLTCAVFVLITGACVVLNPTFARAEDPRQSACEGSGGKYSDNTCKPPTDATDVNKIIKFVINIFSWVVGIAAVVMEIVSGFKYITSQGDPAQTASAKNTLLYAVVGLVVVAFAQIIVRFVLKKATTR